MIFTWIHLYHILQLLWWDDINFFWGGGYFLLIFLWKFNINYRAKSGASSLKIDWVMLNLVFGGHFVFLAAILFCSHFFTFWLRVFKIYGNVLILCNHHMGWVGVGQMLTLYYVGVGGGTWDYYWLCWQNKKGGVEWGGYS